MKEYTRQLMDKGQRAIQAAVTLQRERALEFAAGRAYYAMFYVVEALLEERSLRFSKHGGVHGAFGEHFVKTGLFDAKYHRWLLNAFDRRIAGDYAIQVSFSEDEVQEMIDRAREFWETAWQFLEASSL